MNKTKNKINNSKLLQQIRHARFNSTAVLIDEAAVENRRLTLFDDFTDFAVAG